MRAGPTWRRQPRGRSVIVNGLNPPGYHDWARLIPEITACGSGGGDRPAGRGFWCRGMSMSTGGNRLPGDLRRRIVPCSRKGRIRAEMEARYRAAAERGRRAGADPARRGFHCAGGQGGAVAAGGAEAAGQGADRGDGRSAGAAGACVSARHGAGGVWGCCARRMLPAFVDMPFAGLAFSIDGSGGGDSGDGLMGRVPRRVPRSCVVADAAGSTLLGTGAGVGRDAVSLRSAA